MNRAGWHRSPRNARRKAAGKTALPMLGLVSILVLALSACGRGPEGDETATGATRHEPDHGGTVRAPFTLAVIGDSYSTGSPEGGTRRHGWPRILAGRIEARLVLEAVSGTGWVNPGADGQDFMAQARKLVVTDQHPDLVIAFGSRNDAAYPGDQVQRAVTSALEYLEQTQPQAEIVVVGPCWPVQYPPGAYVDELTAAVRTATAEVAGTTFVDPMADAPWFDGRNGELIGDDRLHPSDAGHRLMARKSLFALRRAELVPSGGR